MALTDSEVARLKAELGYNVLSVDAVPYIGITRVFENVIQQYVTAGAITTSATAVTAVSTPTPVALILTSATGFAAYNTVIIDVDERQEQATIQSLVTTTMTVQLKKAHSGTYPVTVEGPESIIREYLQKLRILSAPGGTFSSLGSRMGVKKVDEIEFFGGEFGSSTLKDVRALQRHFRNELAAILGVPNMRDGAGHSVSPY